MTKALLVALALLAGTATAGEKATVTVSADSKLMDEGILVSDETTVGLDLRFNDVFVPGTFVRADFDSIALTPVNNSVEFRTDLSAGFTGTLGTATVWELAAARTLNPVTYVDDYTEVRARLTRGPLFLDVQQGLTTGVNKDTYVAAGVQQKVGPVTVGALASTVRYNSDALKLREEFEFNNAEVFVKYNIWRDLDVNLNYSYGGTLADGREIDNQFWGGVSYRF